ncbi:MAG: hypothetical protein FJW61_07860 [Actinobacteria bacterium]|nr:hypothetical protein [Actinomycetota bacterium]
MGIYVENAAAMLVGADKSCHKSISSKHISKKTTEIWDIIWKHNHTKLATPKNPGDYYFDNVDGENIERVIYLNNEKGAKDNGHAAIILVKSDGSGIYYSYGIPGEFTDTKFEKIVHGTNVFLSANYPGVLNRRDISPSEMETFMQNGAIPFHGDVEKVAGNSYAPTNNENKLYSYTRYISIPVTGKQGQEMFEEAQKIFNSEGEYKNKIYNLYESNCNHYTQKILGAANLSFTLDSGSGASGGIDVSSVTKAAPQLGVPAWLYNASQAIWELGSKDIKVDRLGTIPNGAYLAGMSQWEVYKDYDCGNFKAKVVRDNTF